MERILYVSDLDGTLLHSNELISEQSCNIINTLIEKGMIFSYATARSIHTASKAARGLDAKMPLIVYNGAFILDNASKERICTNIFSAEDAEEIFTILNDHDIAPIVYSLMCGKEKFSYNTEKLSQGLRDFIGTRKGDVRDNPQQGDDLLNGEVFYFTCIDGADKLYPVYRLIKDRFNCLYQQDIYSGEQWLEIMPKAATKANAVLQLKEIYHCDKIVSFGDGLNDIPMFEISDECYAVENAADELKAIATAVIGSNNGDGVAKWLEKNAVIG